MAPPFSRLTLSTLAVVCLLTGCAHTRPGAKFSGSAPALKLEDTPHPRGGTNPNAPYMLAATNPQLVKRDVSGNGSAEACDENKLEITEISAVMNESYRAVKLAFENHGATACRIGGYPTIQLEDDHGAAIGSIVIEKTSATSMNAALSLGVLPASSSQPTAQITLYPRGQAWFLVGWKSGEGCPIVSRISVFAPDSQKAFLVNRPLTVCEGRVQVTTLQSDSEN